MEKQMKDKFTFDWIIENFSMLYTYVCISFKCNILFPVSWGIELIHQNPDDVDIGVFLYGKNTLEPNLDTRYRFEVFDCNEKNIFSIENWKISKLYRLERKLLRPLIDDILILKFTFNHEWKKNQQYILPPLIFNGLFADVVLLAGGVQFKAHKAILQARWPKLAEKLDAEKTNGLVLNMESYMLEAILKYVYTGNMDFMEYQFLAEVTAAAEAYELPDPICTPVLPMTYRTQINVGKISFEWPIKNFSSLPINFLTQGSIISFLRQDPPSYSFTVYDVDKHKSCKWRLMFHVSEDAPSGRIFSISVCKEGGGRDVLVRSKVSFNESSFSENKHKFYESKIWKFAEFSGAISTDSEDILSLKCELKFSFSSEDSKIVKCLYDSSTPANCWHFERDLFGLYASGQSADVDITVGGLTLSAHRFILCARSPVFLKMLASEMTKSKRSFVSISDVHPDIMKTTLRFLYTNCLEIHNPSDAMKLYAVADKYDIPALKKISSDWLKSRIGIDNIYDVLQLAHTHSSDDLFDYVFEYISAHAVAVFSSEKWKKFSENNACAKLVKKAIIHINTLK